MFKKFIITSFVLLSFCLMTNAQAEHHEIPKRISGGVVNGKAENLPVPEYPAAAKAANVSGSVNVAIVISKTGNVMSASAVSGHPLLRAAAVEAAKRATFKPTLLSGEPVEVSGVLVFNFTPETETPDSNNSEDDSTPLAFAMLVSIYENMQSDADFADIIDEMFTGIAQDEPTLKFTGKFSQKSADEQSVIIEKTKKLFADEKNVGHKWQYEMGESLGKLLGEFYTSVVQEGNLVDESVLIDQLSEIQTLSTFAPKNFPKPIANKIVKIGEYTDNESLADEPTQQEIFQHLLDLFELIAPE